VSSAVKIKLGLQKTVALGNLDAHRDWGYAPDYVQAMWLMLQADTPDDYVVATGKTHSVREFVELVFVSLGLDYQDHVQVDPQFFRPTEKVRLCGNPHKIESVLGWKRTACLSEIIAEMVTAELALHHQE
jgi:GDPmannose 4,6-dehydratase